MAFRVGLLIHSPDNSGNQLLDGIVQYVRLNPHWNAEYTAWWRPKRLTDFLGLDGIIIRPSQNLPIRLVADLSIPVVDVSSSHRKLSHIPRVGVDNIAVGQVGARHFLDRGHKNLAFVGRTKLVFARHRSQGFEQVAKDAGASVFSFTSAGRLSGWSRESVLEPIAQWLKTLPKPLGVMADSDNTARLVLEACRGHLRVPEEVAVVGVDNDDHLCELSTPALSSIALDLQRVGFRAASLLEELMNRRKVAKDPIYLPPGELHVRRSSDVFAVQDEVVAKAMRYIQDNAHEGLTVRNICRHVMTAPRSLELRFRQAIGRSPREEIRLARIRLAKKLLSTPISIASVAAKVGFSSQSRFGFLFKQDTGVSPLAYRRQLHEGREAARKTHK